MIPLDYDNKISYKEYLASYPSQRYVDCFRTLLEARIEVYLAENPSLLPEGVVLSDDEGGYQLIFDNNIESSMRHDGLGITLLAVSKIKAICLRVPLSIAYDAGYEKYLERNHVAKIADLFENQALSRVREYVENNPGLVPEGMVIMDDFMEGYYIKFRSSGKIKANRDGSVFVDFRLNSDFSKDVSESTNEVYFVLEVPFDIVKGS